jgi:hypothetical protein
MNTMTDDQKQLYASLTQLAADFRSVGYDANEQTLIRDRYNHQLALLHALAWTDALGESSELPDALMPKDYLVRRGRILSDLEDRLGLLARRYRGSTTKTAEAQIVEEYRATMDEMYRIGHWVGIPDPDSSLPDELMPPSYHARLQKLIRESK